MLIVGMFFFWVAVMSGLFGFADIYSAHLYATKMVFYSSLLLATLVFSVRLLRPGRIRDASDEESVAEPAPAALVDSQRPEPTPSAPEVPEAAPRRAVVTAGPLVARMR